MSELVPAPGPAERQRGELTEEGRALFLEALSNGWSVTHAARLIGLNRSTVYRHRGLDEEFAEAWEAAAAEGRDVVLDEVRRRAIDGWDEPVFQRGELVGTIRRYSDRMLEILAKGVHPWLRDGAQVEVNVGDLRSEVSMRQSAEALKAAVADWQQRRQQIQAEVQAKQEIERQHGVRLPVMPADLLPLGEEIGIDVRGTSRALTTTGPL